MPKFVQPARLQKIAFDSLVVHVVNYCHELSAKGFLTKLRQGVGFIKKHVRNQMYGILYAQFCRRFLDRFYRIGVTSLNERLTSHYRAVLEVVMDVEIVGLRCEGCIMRYLDPRDGRRFQRLDILDWSELQFCETKPRGLGNFRLQNLTTFVFPRLCTDQDLEIIGPFCPKLQVLRIQESSRVTDRGLRALTPCSELRVMNVQNCRVSDDGVNGLLTVHEKLEEFNISRFYLKGEKGFDVLSRSSSSVCPSMKRFSIQSTPVTDEHLRSVVILFPNLTHLRVCSELMGDLLILRCLDRLTELNFGCGYRCFRMENLKQLLMVVGENISVLNLLHCNPHVCVTQEDIDFIFKFCGNVQYFGFDYEPVEAMETLVIPSFNKLKELECSTLTQYSGSRVVLEFGKMPALQDLKIHGFEVTLQTVESIMLDSVKFPNLRVFLIPYASEEDVNHINQIAREKNLEFLFKNSFWEDVENYVTSF